MKHSLRSSSITAVVAAAAVWSAAVVADENAAAKGSARQAHKTVGLIKQVRDATRRFRDASVAIAEGYAPFLGCVSGPEEGAMGIHFVNGDLVGDNVLDAQQPEILIYEPLANGRLRFVGVEFLVIHEGWHAANELPPALTGQVFHFSGSPNRYGLPPFYELHVWAWRDNPHGTFVDWNPRVSCDEQDPQ